mmetsp:Transcript_21350/g.43825  ORF Transcript_21350/g.43825 Transcript_21350/m.43825 type:complete len:304 (-) Transcript_21350:772-1683(-)
MSILVNHLRSRINLAQTQSRPTHDIEHDPLRLTNGKIQQRRRNGRHRRVRRPRFPHSRPYSHQRRPRILHHRPDIGKIHVDQPRLDDNLRNPHHPLPQNIIRHQKRIRDRSILRHDPQQLIVTNHDQGIHMFPQLLYRLLRLPHPLLPLKRKRLGDHPDRQTPLVPRDLRHDRSGPRSRPSPHPRRDEYHIGPAANLLKFLGVFLSGFFAHFGNPTGAEAAGDVSSDVEDVGGEGFGEGLGVGVDGPEGDAVDAGLDHAVDGVASSASYSEDLDHTGVGTPLGHDDPSIRLQRHLGIPTGGSR